MIPSTGFAQAISETPRSTLPRDVQLDTLLPLLSQSIAQGIIEGVRELKGGGMDTVRRQLLEGLLGAFSTTLIRPADLLLDVANLSLAPEPWDRLLQATTHPSALNKATLDHFEQLLAKSWALCDENELEIAERILASFLPKVGALSSEHEEAAYLASHGLRLQSIFAHHRLHLPQKIFLCEQALIYARYAGDTNTIVLALLELAAAYGYRGKPAKRLMLLQEALHNAAQATPIIQARAYSNTAAACAESGRLTEACQYIDVAFELFPDDPTVDPAYPLADSSIFTLSYHAGKVSTYAGNYVEAFAAFNRYQHHSAETTIPERLRLEIVNGQSRAAIREQDAEKYAHFLADALASSLALGSKKRFDEAHKIFRQDVPAAWRSNSHIASIAETYSLEEKG